MKQSLVDSVALTIKGGNGGDGAISFAHLPGKEKGGPDGGNGGGGGDVVFEVNEQLATLKRFAGRDRFEGERGRIGGKNNRSEHDRKALVVQVPKGTVVWVKRDDYRLLEGRPFYGDDAEKANHYGISNDPAPYKGLEVRWPQAITNDQSPIIKESSILNDRETAKEEQWPHSATAASARLPIPPSHKASEGRSRPFAEPAASRGAPRTDSTGFVQVADLNKPGERLVVARGGRGGLGNTTFKRSRLTTPYLAHKGELGELWRVKLELKVLADVGLVGLPNVGKSSLLAVLTAARPEVADYPFTTITPNLGVIEVNSEQLAVNSVKQRTAHRKLPTDKLVIADIPGLIEDAHEGKGLGSAFLRHIERCRVLVYVLAPESEQLTVNSEQLWEQYRTVRNEVKEYGRGLLEKPFMVVVNKSDLATSDKLQATSAYFREKGITPVMVSALTGEGLPEMTKVMKELAEE